MRDKTLGAALLRVRTALGLSARAMGARMGVSHVHLRNIETGAARMSLERAAAWASKLGEPPADWVQLATQDRLNAAGLRMTVRVLDA